MQLLLRILGFYYWMAGGADARANATCVTQRVEEKQGSRRPEEASLWLPLDGGPDPDGLCGNGPHRTPNCEQLQTGAA